MREGPPARDMAGAGRRIFTRLYRLQLIESRNSSGFILKMASKTVKILKEGKKGGLVFIPGFQPREFPLCHLYHCR
ncbi:MAG: hypothetical protein LLF90_04140 [Methanomicrobiaceae archaeon]|uniref:hypothetical protein n=1 Tax=Methanoculleus sp. TaxID=90427 RepID=UPI003210D11D|nr:hypothetical protein [Methanomicrobiaceae archaeon]